MVQIYHARNLNTIATLGDNTKEKAMKFYNKCIELGAEVLIYEGIRTVEQQRKNVANGKSQTMKSYHLVGQAFDFVPILPNGSADWNAKSYRKEPLFSAINYAKRELGMTWGGDWGWDSPHLQNNFRGYGTDTFKEKGKIPVSVAGVANNPTVLNEIVKSIQEVVSSRYELELEADGYYGKNTREALMTAVKMEYNENYSKQMGATITKLDGSFGATLDKMLSSILLGEGVEVPSRIIYLLQCALYVNGRTEVGALDGIWGTSTTTAVKNFKRIRGYKINDVVGGTVWGALLG